MLRPLVVSAFVLAGAPALAGGVTQAQIDGWLASSSQIARSVESIPGGQPHLRVEVAGSNGGFVFPAEARDGLLANGQEVMILPLVSGGSGGVFTTLLFTKLGGRARFVGYVPSPNGHLDVAVDHGALLIRTPIYGPGSGGNCCPSELHYERATLHGIRLVTLKSWTVPTPKN